MASLPMEECSGSGKNTPEYKSVSNNMEDIINALKTVKGAKECLIMKYWGKGWLPQTANPTEDELVSQVLHRISMKTSEFRIFMDMLNNIKGMDLVVDKLEFRGNSSSGFIVNPRCALRFTLPCVVLCWRFEPPTL